MGASGYRDYFKVLGLERGADADAVKRAFRKLAREYHPDVNPNNKEAEAKFKEISEAYEVLSDSDKRRRYEQFGQYWNQSGGASGGADVDFGRYGNFDDFINDLLGRFGGGGGPSSAGFGGAPGGFGFSSGFPGGGFPGGFPGGAAGAGRAPLNLDAEASISPTSGAVVVNSGGLGVVGNVYVGNNLVVGGNTTLHGNITVLGHSDLGYVSNITITGGNNNQVLVTDGQGVVMFNTLDGVAP